jgi:hypothetical protein
VKSVIKKQKLNHRVRLSYLLSSILVMRRPINHSIFLNSAGIFWSGGI